MTIERRFFEVTDATAIALCHTLYARRTKALEDLTAIAREHGFNYPAIQDSALGISAAVGFMEPRDGVDLSRYRRAGEASNGEPVYMPKRVSVQGKRLADEIEHFPVPSKTTLLDVFELRFCRLTFPPMPHEPRSAIEPAFRRLHQRSTLKDWEVREGKRFMQAVIGLFGDRFLVAVPERLPDGATFPGHAWLTEHTMRDARAIMEAARAGSEA